MKKVLLLLLCMAMVAFNISGCVRNVAVTEPSDSTVTFKITIQTSGGTCLEKVRVRIYADAQMTQMVDMGITNDSGEVTFEGTEGHAYTASLEELPVGYVPEQTYTVTGLDSVIMPAVDTLTDAAFESATYSLGDAVMDFSVTAADGKEYRLFELLDQKKAVVLNFWYLECNPCKLEFPHFQQVYEKYSGEVEFVAMNPVNTDPGAVKAFQDQNGYTFPMAVCDPRWSSLMGVRAYPTTVVIDRFGSICLMHNGMITETDPLENMLAFFTSDDYEQQFFRSISMIPARAG